jgi:hypothetical protein
VPGKISLLVFALRGMQQHQRVDVLECIRFTGQRRGRKRAAIAPSNGERNEEDQSKQSDTDFMDVKKDFQTSHRSYAQNARGETTKTQAIMSKEMLPVFPSYFLILYDRAHSPLTLSVVVISGK